jgi:hypothetical protein
MYLRSFGAKKRNEKLIWIESKLRENEKNIQKD